MIYACRNNHRQGGRCPRWMVAVEIEETDGALSPDDENRWCVECRYPMARYPGRFPEPPVEQVFGWPSRNTSNYNPVPDQWSAIRAARGAQLTQTDWILNPPSDITGQALAELRSHQAEWVAWRKKLRQLTDDTTVDPTTIVWPLPPTVPEATLTPPPGFLTTPSWPGRSANTAAQPPVFTKR